MTDKRLAEIEKEQRERDKAREWAEEKGFANDRDPLESESSELLQAMKAERAEVARLKARACDEIEAHVNRRLAAESKLRAVGGVVLKLNNLRNAAVGTTPYSAKCVWRDDVMRISDELEALLKKEGAL